MSSSRTVELRGGLLGSADLEVLGADAHGRPGAVARHRVEQRAIDVDREGVAPLVALRVVRRLAAAALDRQRVPAEALAAQPAEDVGERPHAELARRARGELHPPALTLKVAGLLERLGELAQLLEVVQRVVSGEVSQGIGIHLVERVGVARGGERLLHRVVLLLAVDGGERIGEAHRLVALERIRVTERKVRARRLEVSRQPRHVDPQPVVSQQVVHQAAELVAHLRRHAVEQARHLRRLAVEMLDELLQVRDPRREVASVLRHERAEVVGRIGSGGVLLEERIEVADHLAHPVEVLRRDLLDSLLEPGEVGLQHLLAQLVGELRERVARGVVHELVVLEAVKPAGEVRREGVEPVLALARGAAHDLFGHPRLVLLSARRRVERALLRRPDPFANSLALRLEDLLQAPVEVVQHAVEVGSLELRLARARSRSVIRRSPGMSPPRVPRSPRCMRRWSARRRSPSARMSSEIASSTSSASKAGSCCDPSHLE